MPDEWIRQWGDPALRAIAAPVTSFDDLLAARVRRMKQQLDDAEGAGLAATQVGFMRRLFVFRAWPEDEIDVLVNPVVEASSSEWVTFLEGCLSYQSITVAVERPLSVVVGAQTLDGTPRQLEASGHEASLLQHEIDHLDGILTLDRASLSERRRAIGLLRDERAADLHPTASDYGR
jgi:peptide deformylase